MLADLVALQTTGSILGPEKENPECLTQLRVIDMGRSFNAPMEEFDGFASLRNALRCCSRYSNETLSERGRLYCETFTHLGAEQRMPPHSASLFTPEAYIENREVFDIHMLGVPPNSFLLNLGRTLGIDALRMFLLVVKERSGTDVLPAMPPEFGSDIFPGGAKPLLENFMAMKTRFTSADQLVFDELWDTHGMDILRTIADAEVD